MEFDPSIAKIQQMPPMTPEQETEYCLAVADGYYDAMVGNQREAIRTDISIPWKERSRIMCFIDGLSENERIAYGRSIHKRISGTPNMGNSSTSRIG